jgi:hypothetical protein
MVEETIRKAEIPVEDPAEDLLVAAPEEAVPAAAATVEAVPAGIPAEDLPVAEGPV